MWVVGMERVFGSYLNGLGSVPGCSSIPSAMVLSRIFEVAVLNQLGIEATVGCIADILKEDTYELVADDFLTVHVDSQRSTKGLTQRCEVLGIIMHTLC